MQKLIVRNFGPIKELDLDIKDLSLFIGEQATGKSTVAKLVYFFKKVVKDELIGFLFSIQEKEVALDKGFGEIRYEFKDDVILSFFKIFSGANAYFELDFKYKEGTCLHIDNLDSSRKTLNFSFTSNWYGTIEPGISDKDFATSNYFNKVCEEIIEFRKKYLSGERGFSEFEMKEKRFEIIALINEFFGEEKDREVIFIPAGRNMLTALSDRLPNKGWDYLMEEFRGKIADLKHLFYQPLQSLISDKKQRGNNMPSTEVLDYALKNIKEILKGEYRVDKDGEKLYFDDKRFVKISLASSGQQEVVWILLQLFILILNQEKVFLIIEEPEAHLFPKAQKSLVELIALLFNENNSQVIITTHSPYILTSFNNLIYAGNVGQEHEEVGDIISKPLWLDIERVGAYKLANGISEDLIDAETKMIKAEELDTVSRTINHDFDALLNLELQ